MAKANFVKKARKDVSGTDIKKGDSYYWWSFRFGGKHYSKTPPKRSQLTSSSILSTMYEIEDRIEGLSKDIDFADEISEIISELESLKDECQDSLDNIPEQLQEGSAGTLLQERIEAIEDMVSELGDIDVEIEEEKTEGESQEDYEERINTRKSEILDALQQIGYGGN